MLYWYSYLARRRSSNLSLQTDFVVEDSVAPFFCTGGCGGRQITSFDITQYQFGDCASFNVCR